MSAINVIKAKLRRKLRKDDRANLKNAFINSGGHVITVLSLLITTPLLLSKLGKEGMGIIVLAKSFLGMTGVMAFGMGQATLKFVSKYQALGNPARVHRVIRTTLTFYAVMGVIAALGQFLLAPLLGTHVFKVSPESHDAAVFAFKVGALGLLGALLSESVSSALRGFERFDLSVGTDVVAKLLLLVGQVTLLLRGAGVEEIIVFFVCVKVGTPLVLMQLLRLRAAPGLRIYPQVEREILRESFNFGLFTWIGGLLNKLRTQGIPWIIGALVGADAVAIYSIGANLLGHFVKFLSQATAYLFPYVSRIHEQGNKEEVEKHYGQVTKILLILSAAGTTPIFVCALPVLARWLNPEVAPQIMLITQILAMRFAVLPFGFMNYAFIVATGKVKALVVVQSIACLVVVTATLLGANYGGLEGATWAQLSVFLTLIGNRLFIEKQLFGRMSALGQISLVAAVGLPLLLGLPFVLGAEVNLFVTALAAVLWAAIGAAVAWIVLWIKDSGEGWFGAAGPTTLAKP